MNGLQIFLLVAALSFGAYGAIKVKELIGSNKPNHEVENRYLECISLKDAGTCATNELMLRALQCKS